MMQLSLALKTTRQKAFMTQEAFAKMYSVTRQTVSNWENEKSYPDLSTLVKISDEFNVSLDVLLKGDFRMALVTTHIPVREIATTITKELIQEKLMIFHRCLKQDFGIGAPRIAVLALNPHAGDGGLLGMEEQEVIIPALKEMEEKGILCMDYSVLK